ncbi:MAG: enoyl-CoA hydratase/isomerase family protein [Acidimicrobiia bacterium]|jgi:2-(1,2-epoxy-1,2-dihydrophenyl)acetyl-CoA isomerase
MIENPETLILERDGAVLWVRLNRPEARNGINMVMREELQQTFEAVDDDAEIRAMVLTGQDRTFCTGGDLMPAAGNGKSAMTQPTSQMDYRRAVRPFQELTKTYWQMSTPVVSAVNGTTAGMGWMLALLADLVVAAEGARWTHVFARRGMVPHAGDPFFLPRVVPFHRLNEAMLLSDTLTSETIAEWGCVNRLVPADQVDATAGALAQQLAAGPTRSLGISKQMYRRSLTNNMETMFYEEADATALVTQTTDRYEGVKSLMENRPPEFTGN